MYVLESWRSPPEPDNGWLREVPSRFLNARFAIVDFCGRDDELYELRRWRDGERRLSGCWLHAPGGQGKTRLAAQLAEESAAMGWKVVAAVHGPGGVLPQPGSQDLTLDGAEGLLVIVDYADRWPASHLAWLLSNALLHHPGVPTRVLMIGRTLEAWFRVRGLLAEFRASTSALFVPPVSLEAGDRRDNFDAALRCFAARYEVRELAAIDRPDEFRREELGLTLNLHMAALVAVDAHVAGHRLPDNVEALTIYLLDREHLHWTRLYGDGTAWMRPAGHGYVTAPQAMNRVVFGATLSGPHRRAAGLAVAAKLGLPDNPDRLVDDHLICYPPANSDAGSVLAPLYPDRLAEDFLALTVPGHGASYPAQAWSPGITADLLAEDQDNRGRPGFLPRAVTFLATAAQRWPHLGDRLLYPLLRNDPQLAVRAGGAALAALAAIADIDTSVLEGIEPFLPEFSDLDLDDGIAPLYARIAAHRLSVVTEPAQRAAVYSLLRDRFGRAGRLWEAKTAGEQAVALYTELAATDPGKYELLLAHALGFLSNNLSDLGSDADGLAAMERAVEITSRLADQNPTAYEAQHARLLSALSARLLNTGQVEEATAAGEKALNLLSRQMEAGQSDASRYFPDTWARLAVCYVRQERVEEAVWMAEAAVKTLAMLAEANPDHVEPKLAMTLEYLADALSLAGRGEEALAAARQAHGIMQRFALSSPLAYARNYEDTVRQLSGRLREEGEYDEAAALDEELVSMYQQVAALRTAEPEPSLSDALNHLGAHLAQMGKTADAVSVGQRAVAISRNLARSDPGMFEPALAAALDHLGLHLKNAGRSAEGADVGQEAVTILRRLAAARPGVHDQNLAAALNNLALSLHALGRREESATAVRQAIRLCRQAEESRQAAFRYCLACSLQTYALVMLDDETGSEEAIISLQEAAEILLSRYATNPAESGPDLRRVLLRAGDAARQLGLPEEARDLYQLTHRGAIEEAALMLLALRPDSGAATVRPQPAALSPPAVTVAASTESPDYPPSPAHDLTGAMACTLAVLVLIAGYLAGFLLAGGVAGGTGIVAAILDASASRRL